MVVRDSSLYFDPMDRSPRKFHGDITAGIVRSEEYQADIDTVFYLVEVTHSGVSYILNCRQMAKFGDVYNYEEWGVRRENPSSPSPRPTSYASRVGEVVLVAHIGGSPNDGVIVGSLRHPGRKSKITDGSISYISEFNGLETTVDASGAYKVKFQGTPTTVASLKSASASGKIPEAKYDTTVAGSYLSFLKDGSFEVSDANSAAQSIKIDKANGKVSITSGKVTIVMAKEAGTVAVESSELTINAKKKLKVTTESFSVEASKEVKLKGSKVAIGSGSVELLDSIIKLVDAIGTLVVSSPVGPCSPVKSAPTWAQLEQIKTQLSGIKGSL